MFPEPSVKEWMPSASIAVEPLMIPQAALAAATMRFKARICHKTLAMPRGRACMCHPQTTKRTTLPTPSQAKDSALTPSRSGRG